jgi:hypothetical protein
LLLAAAAAVEGAAAAAGTACCGSWKASWLLAAVLRNAREGAWAAGSANRGKEAGLCCCRTAMAAV